MTDRYLAQESCDVEDILHQEIVKWKHIWLFDSEEDVVGEILDDLGYEQKPTAHLFRWRS